MSVLLATLVISGVVLFVSCNTSERAENSRILEIRDQGSGKVYGKWPLDETGEFAVEFIHSVHQSPVRETFKTEGKMIKPMAVRFYSFGAGMQSDLEEGWKLDRDGDAMVISGFSASFKELNYIVGTVSDHILYINGGVYSLRDLCGRNAHISVRLR